MSSCPYDAFHALRPDKGVVPATIAGEDLTLLLKHEAVRRAAKDWETFSSDAPFRVPIPSEEDVRRMRQLPIETNPPEHTEYRKIVEPVFRRPAQPEFVARVEQLIGGMLEEAGRAGAVEVVRGFALPLQSRALTYLLNVPETEAEEWIGWGVHVFHDGGDGAAKGAVLEHYLQRKLDEAAAKLGEDFFSDLVRAEYQGRRLSREEQMGFANLTFAGGRDTIINMVAGILHYFAQHPAALEQLRAEPKSLLTAVEEFVRVLSPLTHIGRVCPVETVVGGVTVPAGTRVALGWAAANFDSNVFDHPEEVRLNRRPNPHVAFGVGAHFCLGAAHARLIVRTLLRQLCAQVESLTLVEAIPHVEREAAYERWNGFQSLTLRFGLKEDGPGR
jgi:cytochrome P450